MAELSCSCGARLDTHGCGRAIALKHEREFHEAHAVCRTSLTEEDVRRIVREEMRALVVLEPTETSTREPDEVVTIEFPAYKIGPPAYKIEPSGKSGK